VTLTLLLFFYLPMQYRIDYILQCYVSGRPCECILTLPNTLLLTVADTFQIHSTLSSKYTQRVFQIHSTTSKYTNTYLQIHQHLFPNTLTSFVKYTTFFHPNTVMIFQIHHDTFPNTPVLIYLLMV
jgi:hypothetical protein